MQKLLLTASLSAMLAGMAIPATANEELQKMQQDPNQWVMQTGDYSNHRFSKLKQITAANVGELEPVWTFSTGVLRGHEGGPLVIGDVMYVHGPFPNPIFALDLNNAGKILWKYEPKQDPSVIPVMCCDTVNRGLAYADGKLFLNQADTTLIALDAKTGKLLWSVKNGDPSKGETGTSVPVVVKDKVLVGVSGAEFGVRGRLTAYDMKTGKQDWIAYSTGPDKDMLVDPEKTTELGKPIGENSSLKTWEGDQWKTGGGSTWGWYSYDPKLNLIYYGTANPSTWNPVQRPGDNKWSMTIFARDPDTGMAKWAYQMTPHDQWDYDGINEMILADQEMGGKMRKTLVHFDRNGFGYTLDRETGELLVAEKYDPAVNWATKIDMDKSSKNYGRPEVVAQYAPGSKGEDVNYTNICPAALGKQGRAASKLLARYRSVLRADKPRLHGLRALPRRLYRRAALCRRNLVDVPGSWWKHHGQLHRLGRQDRQDRVVRSRAVLGVVRRDFNRGRRGLLRHARRIFESGRCEDGQGTLQVQDPVRHYWQRRDLHA